MGEENMSDCEKLSLIHPGFKLCIDHWKKNGASDEDAFGYVMGVYDLYTSCDESARAEYEASIHCGLTEAVIRKMVGA